MQSRWKSSGWLVSASLISITALLKIRELQSLAIKPTTFTHFFFQLMKSRHLASCLLVSTGLFLPLLKAEDPAEKVIWNNPQTFTAAGLSHHNYASAAMATEVGYSVWLPPDYETSSARYPVIYFLHGMGGNESADAAGFSQILVKQLAAGKIPPVICVFPNGGKSGYRDHADTHVNVESMLIRELVPLIDKTYRTRADRNSRVLGGFSMGGGGSVRLALQYPELFSAAASWAGAIGRPQGDKFVAALDPHLLEQRSLTVRLLMIVGYEDLTYPWHAAPLEAFRTARYPFTLHTLEGVGHELGKYYDLTGAEFATFLTKEFTAQPQS